MNEQCVAFLVFRDEIEFWDKRLFVFASSSIRGSKGPENGNLGGKSSHNGFTITIPLVLNHQAEQAQVIKKEPLWSTS